MKLKCCWSFTTSCTISSFSSVTVLYNNNILGYEGNILEHHKTACNIVICQLFQAYYFTCINKLFIELCMKISYICKKLRFFNCFACKQGLLIIYYDQCLLSISIVGIYVYFRLILRFHPFDWRIHRMVGGRGGCQLAPTKWNRNCNTRHGWKQISFKIWGWWEGGNHIVQIQCM